jgi:hypothetical protein
MKRMAALLATAAAISAVVPATAGATSNAKKCGPILMLIPLCK